jgi:methionine-rich copper-binding protein CopC/HAMP domain-containing protein
LITNDAIFEAANETFGLVVQRNTTDNDATFLAKSTFTITDNDPQPTTYALTPASTSVNEAAGTVTFTITRSGGTPAETIFASTTTGEGSANSGDFTSIADQAIVFAAGELTKTVTVSITNDTISESNETFGLVVQRNTTDADTTFLAKSLFTIQDNDAPPTTYSMTPATTSVSEGVGTVTFTITRSGGTPAETIFASTTTGEGFANSGDFLALADQAISFAAGELTKTVTVNITNDTLIETSETFGLVVQRNTTDADTTFLSKSVFTILDNDSAPDTVAPTLTTTSPADNTTNIALNANIVFTFNEAVQAGTGTLRLVNQTTGAISLINVTDTSQVTFSGNTMTVNPTANLNANTPYELRMPTAGTVKDLAGNNFATLSNPINFTTGTSVLVETTYALSPVTTTVDEGVGTITFTITRSGTTPAETIFASTTTGEGSANSGDFTAIADQAVVFAAGETSKTVTISVTNDALFEATNETFGLVVQRNTTDADTTFLAKSTFTITDNDTQPTTYAMSPGTISIDEGAGTVTFTVTRSGGTPAETIFASTTTGEGSANSGDFTALADQAIAFAAGELSKTVTVSITNDALIEANETFGLVVQRNTTDADTTFLAKSTFTITDNDTPPTTYALTPATTTVDEAAGTITFTITRSGGTPAETIFASTTTGEGSANSGDFTALADQAISFAAGELTKTVTVSITNDAIFEAANETFGLVVQRNTTDNDATFLAKSTFTVTDNDPQPTTYSMTPVTTSVSEGVGTVTFTVTRSGGTPAETIFASTTTGEGSANSGDFTALADQAISFAAGELTKTVTVAITNDTTSEANETFGLVVQRNTTDADATFLAKSTFTIQDNDAPPTTYSMTPATTSVSEGVGTVTFTITRSAGAPAETIFASTTTGEGFANSGDFLALADQAIAFAAGELTKTVTVNITNDTLTESSETFGLVVQRNTTDADTTFLSKSVFTILDNDGAPDTIAPTLTTTSPADNSTGIALNANIVFTFNEAVQAGTGVLRLFNLANGSVTFINVTDTSQVSFSGNTMTVNPTANLLANTAYELRMPTAGTVKDLAGNNFATLSNPVNFTTGTSLAAPQAFAPSSTIEGTNGNDILVGTAGDNTLLGKGGTDKFVWTTTNGTGDGIGNDTIDARSGERLDFNFSLLQTLKLSSGSLLTNGALITSGNLLGGAQPSLAMTDADTLAFDWNGDGVADLNVNFTVAPRSLTYDAQNGDLLVG